MANTRFGNFQELSQGKKPMTAEEAWAMLNQLGLLVQEFVPGAVSIRKVFEGKPIEAVEELQDWIPGNAAYQNLIRGKDQDWVRNALDLAIVGKPLAKGTKKAMEAIERMPKGGKGGFIVKPEYPFKKESHKEATERLADAWTNEARDNGYIARPQSPHPVDYASKKANDITDERFRYPINISRTYKDPSGRTVTENAAQLAAILPENATEAAYIRHKKTPYDNMLQNIRHNMESDKGLRQSFRRVPTLNGFEDQLLTVDGTYANRTDRAKNKIFDAIEAQMPGYREAANIPDPRYMRERGLNIVTIFDPEIDRKIARKEADIEFLGNLLKDEEVMRNNTPEKVNEVLETLRKELRDLQNLKTEQTLDALD